MMVNLIKKCFCILSLLCITGLLNAEPVHVFEKTPSAEEMRSLLFPEKKETATESESDTSEESDLQGASRGLSVIAKKTSIPENLAGQPIGLLINFKYDSYQIEPDSLPAIEQIAKLLIETKSANKKLLIEGHADAIGDSAYNMQLSEKRANAIKEYLIKNYAIEPYRLSSIGYGKTKPLEGVDPLDGKNRRVQLRPQQ